MNKHLNAAAFTIAATALLDTALGFAFAGAEHISAWDGLYWSVTTATTVGYGDIVPRGIAAHLIATAVMLTCIPLFAATFSLLTSGLSASHVESAERRIREHVSGALHYHLGSPAAPVPPASGAATIAMPAGSAGTSGRKPPQREGGP